MSARASSRTHRVTANTVQRSIALMNQQSQDVLCPRGLVTRFGKRYPGIWAKIDALRAERSETSILWPDYCFLPYTLARDLVLAEHGLASGGMPADRSLITDVFVVMFLSAWRVTQGIYRFDPTLYDALRGTPIEGELPVDLLHRLPEWCVYLELSSFEIEGRSAQGVFAQVTAESDGNSTLRLLFPLEAGPLSYAVVLHGTLAEALQHTNEQTAKWKLPVHSEHDEANSTAIGHVISLLLYICSEAADIGDGAARPSMPAPTRTRKGLRYFPPDQSTTWDVGVRLGAALRSAYRDADGDGAGDERGRPRPHIRRAHWHTFLSGPRLNPKRSLRWLPPIPVNLDSPEQLPATIRPVLMAGVDAR